MTRPGEANTEHDGRGVYFKTAGNLTCEPGSLERFVPITETELPRQPVGWCWERNPHTWLGMASAGNRRAAAWPTATRRAARAVEAMEMEGQVTEGGAGGNRQAGPKSVQCAIVASSAATA
ncbi:DUF5701 family protein [Nonomuraea jabiensis]|uniref:DUF5701 family protein n=1 Tax=Nonomuraea jabiensis TaxID=882448 RepID=UPI003D74DF61